MNLGFYCLNWNEILVINDVDYVEGIDVYVVEVLYLFCFEVVALLLHLLLFFEGTVNRN